MSINHSRKTCVAILREWEESSKFIDTIIEQQCGAARLDTRDRAFVQNITLGIIRNLTLIESWLHQLRKGKTGADVRRIVYLGLYQVLLMRVPDHAAVNETVNLARPRARGLINAILRRATRERDQLLKNVNSLPPADRYSIPDHLFTRWERHFGSDAAESIASQTITPAPLTVRTNLLRGGLTDEDLTSAGATPLKDYPEFYTVNSLPLDALGSGRCYAQDPSTSIAPQLLAPEPGHAVLDACAAPGGKTAILAMSMCNSGSIIASDVKGPRSNRLENNLIRLGVNNVTVKRGDLLDEENPLLKQTRTYDRILIDVPCSNTGVLRRRADAKWRLLPGFAEQLTKLQLRLIRSVLPLMKEGGRIAYSTCSVDSEENEQVIGKILEEYPKLTKIDEVSLFPKDHHDGAYVALLG